MTSDSEFTSQSSPPHHPPPLLSYSQVAHLAKNGWLPIDLPPHVQDSLKVLSTVANSLFTLTAEEKCALLPTTHGTESGYYDVPDSKEYFSLPLRHSQVGDGVNQNGAVTGAKIRMDNLDRAAADMWRDSAAILQRVLVDVARGMNWDLSCYDSMLEECLELPSIDDPDVENLPSVLRCFKYAPFGGVADKHTDNGLLTLCVGFGKGLMVVDREKQKSLGDGAGWVDVDGPVVLVGDVLESLTQGKVKAGIHGVVGNENGRSSIVFALRPSMRKPVPGKEFGRNEGDMRELWDKRQKSKFNVNARRKPA